MSRYLIFTLFFLGCGDNDPKSQVINSCNIESNLICDTSEEAYLSYCLNKEVFRNDSRLDKIDHMNVYVESLTAQSCVRIEKIFLEDSDNIVGEVCLPTILGQDTLVIGFEFYDENSQSFYFTIFDKIRVSRNSENIYKRTISESDIWDNSDCSFYFTIKGNIIDSEINIAGICIVPSIGECIGISFDSEEDLMEKLNVIREEWRKGYTEDVSIHYACGEIRVAISQ